MLNVTSPTSMLTAPALAIPLEGLLPVLITTVVFVVVGLIVFALAFFIISKATPFSVREEIEKDHNVALAIVIGSVILGTAIIIERLD